MANRHYHFKFNVEKDATYIQRLDAQENMQNYIRRLILSDIAADGLKEMIRFSDPDEDYYIARENFYASHCPAIADPEASCKGCMYYDPKEYGGNCNIENEFREQYRRDDLISRYCQVGDDDPDYCYACPWSYHPDNYSDVIRCKFEGLSADEMEQVIKEWHDRIIKKAFHDGATHANTEDLNDDRSN